MHFGVYQDYTGITWFDNSQIIRIQMMYEYHRNSNWNPPHEVSFQWKEDIMLVLSRKKNESIVINDNITIVVVEIRGDKVRLGIEAPKDVPVHRKEIFDAIQASQMPQHENSEV